MTEASIILVAHFAQPFAIIALRDGELLRLEHVPQPVDYLLLIKEVVVVTEPLGKEDLDLFIIKVRVLDAILGTRLHDQVFN